MRMSAFSIIMALAVTSSAGLAQQRPGTATGPGPALSPPPLSDPPPLIPPPPAVTMPPAVPTPSAAGVTALTPGSHSSSAGADSAGNDVSSTASVKFVPCGRFARETDGSTTCNGIPEAGSRTKRKPGG
jgi:hypothetical protein